jgi:hypothetical protein
MLKKNRACALATLVAMSATAAMAMGPDVTDLDSDLGYREARRFIAEMNYAPAIPKLEELLLTNPGSPVVLNWLAYSHRKLKNYPVSKQFYDSKQVTWPLPRRTWPGSSSFAENAMNGRI